MYAFQKEGFRREGCPLFNAKYDVNDSGDLNIANNISKNPRTLLEISTSRGNDIVWSGSRNRQRLRLDGAISTDCTPVKATGKKR